MSNLGFLYGEAGDSGPIVVQIVPGAPLPPTSLPNVVTPEQFGAKGDGVTNDYAACQAAVATGKNVYFGQKYLVNGASPAMHVTTPGQTLFGNGDESQILTTSDITVIKINVEGCTVRSLRITGNSAGVAQFGIGSTDLAGGVGANSLRIESVTLESLATAGIILFGGAIPLLGPFVTGCRAHNCGIGFWTLTEYGTFVSCEAKQCATGYDIEAGNVLISACFAVSCTVVGMLIDAGGNDGHGAVVGCSFNHNTIDLKFAAVINQGMPIVCCNFYGPPGSIQIGVAGAGAKGARFRCCAIAVPVNVGANSHAVVTDNLWPVSPNAVTVDPTGTIRFDGFNVDLNGQLSADVLAAAATQTTAFEDLVQGMLGILPAIAAPAAPAAGFRLYVDAADGKLKAIGSGGTVTPLANP